MTLFKYLINSLSLFHFGSPWILFRGVVKDPTLPERKSPKGRWTPWATGGCSVISHPQNTPCLWPSYRLEQAVRQWLEHLNLIVKQSFPEENGTWTLCCFWNHFLFNFAQGNVWSPPILKEKSCRVLHILGLRDFFVCSSASLSGRHTITQSPMAKGVSSPFGGSPFG